MINTNYSERYMSTYTSRINSNDVAKTSDNDFANAVGKAEGDANAQKIQKKSGKIAESMQKYPEYANDWKREIENGHKLTAIYPSSKSRDEMTMDEYKSYINSVIDKIPEDPSRATTESSIHITDEAWETMKDDPDFEAYVLGGIEDVFTFHNPWMSPPTVKRWEVMQIGVPMENYSGSSWGDMSLGVNDDAENLFKTRSKGESYHKKPDPVAIKSIEERQREQKRMKEKRRKEMLDDKYEKQKRERIDFDRAFYLRSTQGINNSEPIPVMSGPLRAYEMIVGL